VISFLLGASVAASAVYQVLAIVAALRHLRRSDALPGQLPGISVLKPVRGLDPHFGEALRSHMEQDYPEFELLYGSSNPDDPAIAAVRSAAGESPSPSIRVVRSESVSPNGKAAVLGDLASQARHSVYVVNDSDIRVPRDYLRRVVAPLSDPQVGLVTCLYRATADAWPGRWEAIGIATDFAPGVLVAPLFGVSEFGLGSTLCFRRADLLRIGGFDSIANYLADDYQLGRSIGGLGLRVVLSRVVVETSLSGESWAQVWQHQLRWARTIRVSRGGGYLGLPLTNASLWALGAALYGWGWLAVGLLALRLCMGAAVGVGVLNCRLTRSYWYLIPLRDLWGFAIWTAGLLGSEVVWRDQRIKLDREGRIVRVK